MNLSIKMAKISTLQAIQTIKSQMQIICMHLRQSTKIIQVFDKLLYAFEIVKKTGLFI